MAAGDATMRLGSRRSSVIRVRSAGEGVERLLQAVRRGQPGEAPADDRYRTHAEPSAASNAASSTSPCTADVNEASNADGGR